MCSGLRVNTAPGMSVNMKSCLFEEVRDGISG